MQVDTQGYNEKPFKFTGNAVEFFGIWVVNIALTIVSLGIYSAWAKVRTKQYFYGNTLLDHSAFQYLATPVQILKGRIITVLFFGFYYALSAMNPIWSTYVSAFFAVLIPAVIVLSMSFRMRNTAYRNISFQFQRNFTQAYLIFSGPVILFAALFYLSSQLSTEIEVSSTLALSVEDEFKPPLELIGLIVAAFLLYPFWEFFRTHFIITNMRFGTSEFQFDTHAGSFYKVYGIALLLLILVVTVYTAILTSLELISYIDIQYLSEGAPLDDNLIVVGILSIFALYLWLYAYIQTAKTNMILNHVKVAGMPLESGLSVSYMFYLYISNVIAITSSAGLLIPWTLIRVARYRAQTLVFLTDKSVGSFIPQQQKELSAIGEEFGDLFNINIGI